VAVLLKKTTQQLERARGRGQKKPGHVVILKYQFYGTLSHSLIDNVASMLEINLRHLLWWGSLLTR
jgi:hypothetical protein